MTFNISDYLKDYPKSYRYPLCVGILNLTPDSFHDGGLYLNPDAACEQYEALQKQGADMVDIGGMSSRPGHTLLSWQEEWKRLQPFLERIKEKSGVPLSVDTDKPEVAENALDAGVSMINDCSGYVEGKMFSLAAERQVPMVIMHRAGAEGKHANIQEDVLRFFEGAMGYGIRRGMKEWQFVLDPGLGFGKNIQENMQLMDGLAALKQLGRPLYLGYSHKRFAAAYCNETPGAAPKGNALLAHRCLEEKISFVRVHEPELFWQATREA